MTGIVLGILLIVFAGIAPSAAAPVHAVGTGSADWWIRYPSTYPPDTTMAGKEVSHPSWVLDELARKPLLIVGYTQTCPVCKVQMGDIDSVLGSISGIRYITVDGGTDIRGYEFSTVYQPSDGPQFVPMTILLTLVDDGFGKVVVGWHARLGATGKDWLNEYIDDAIFYHSQNKDKWSR